MKTGIMRYQLALFDIDGTLLDSNDAHARAWTQALMEHMIVRPISQVRALIGMGGDKLLPTIASLHEDSDDARAITARKKELFASMLPELPPTRGARALLRGLKDAGVQLAIATSAGDDEVEALLKQAGVGDFFETRASTDDVEHSKPNPDVIQAALEKAGIDAKDAVMIGDTPYDIEAAERANVDGIALRCGGYWPEESFKGAKAVYDDPEALWLASLQAAAR